MPIPYETIPPLAIIAGAIALMGALPGGVQLLMFGKPRPVGQDAWDRQVAVRDEHLLKEFRGAKQ